MRDAAGLHFVSSAEREAADDRLVSLDASLNMAMPDTSLSYATFDSLPQVPH
jgi:hypothetical protein